MLRNECINTTIGFTAEEWNEKARKFILETGLLNTEVFIARIFQHGFCLQLGVIELNKLISQIPGTVS